MLTSLESCLRLWGTVCSIANKREHPLRISLLPGLARVVSDNFLIGGDGLCLPRHPEGCWQTPLGSNLRRATISSSQSVFMLHISHTHTHTQERERERERDQVCLCLFSSRSRSFSFTLALALSLSLSLSLAHSCLSCLSRLSGLS
jgi:hypothetical protein